VRPRGPGNEDEAGLDSASLGVKSEAKLYMRKSLPGTTE
jgi:hypothetical protein